jgi:hypothetical protein
MARLFTLAGFFRIITVRRYIGDIGPRAVDAGYLAVGVIA